MNSTGPLENKQQAKLIKVIKRLRVLLAGFIIIAIISILILFNRPRIGQSDMVASQSDSILSERKPVGRFAEYFNPDSFDIEQVANPVEKSFILYGKNLVDETEHYIGPEVINPAMRYSGNNLTCSNCHLSGGTRPFSAPYVGVWGAYPNFRGRDNILGTLEDRINGCMERSMNGKPLPVDGKEMKAMLAYIKFLNNHVPTGEKIKGRGFATINIPSRAADPKQGGIVYNQHCSSCHGKDGQGLRKGKPGDGQGYLYPPLWGPDSFNDGAGMHRLLTAARFIKANMPFGTPVGKPVLSDGEAYDVAAYINSFPRPKKAYKEKDYPDLKLKPQDCPYPPYADSLPLKQHQLGPYVFNH